MLEGPLRFQAWKTYGSVRGIDGQAFVASPMVRARVYFEGAAGGPTPMTEAGREPNVR
jgi:hypothetical protein